MTLTLDKAGRVLNPKPMRDELRLGPGDELELQADGEQITLRPIRSKAILCKEHGVWVYQGERTAGSIDLIERDRENRIRGMLGLCR